MWRIQTEKRKANLSLIKKYLFPLSFIDLKFQPVLKFERKSDSHNNQSMINQSYQLKKSKVRQNEVARCSNVFKWLHMILYSGILTVRLLGTWIVALAKINQTFVIYT